MKTELPDQEWIAQGAINAQRLGHYWLTREEISRWLKDRDGDRRKTAYDIETEVLRRKIEDRRSTLPSRYADDYFVPDCDRGRERELGYK